MPSVDDCECRCHGATGCAAEGDRRRRVALMLLAVAGLIALGLLVRPKRPPHALPKRLPRYLVRERDQLAASLALKSSDLMLVGPDAAPHSRQRTWLLRPTGSVSPLAEIFAFHGRLYNYAPFSEAGDIMPAGSLTQGPLTNPAKQMRAAVVVARHVWLSEAPEVPVRPLSVTPEAPGGRERVFVTLEFRGPAQPHTPRRVEVGLNTKNGACAGLSSWW